MNQEQHPSTSTPAATGRAPTTAAPTSRAVLPRHEVRARGQTELVPGSSSNLQQGRASNNTYFTALVETAAWGAELATALAGTPNGSKRAVEAVPSRLPPGGFAPKGDLGRDRRSR
jgi:hypothetical protein